MDVESRILESISLAKLSKWNPTPCSIFLLTLKLVLGDFLCSIWSIEIFGLLNLLFFFFWERFSLYQGHMKASGRLCTYLINPLSLAIRAIAYMCVTSYFLFFKFMLPFTRGTGMANGQVWRLCILLYVHVCEQHAHVCKFLQMLEVWLWRHFPDVTCLVFWDRLSHLSEPCCIG